MDQVRSCVAASHRAACGDFEPELSQKDSNFKLEGMKLFILIGLDRTAISRYLGGLLAPQTPQGQMGKECSLLFYFLF